MARREKRCVLISNISSIAASPPALTQYLDSWYLIDQIWVNQTQGRRYFQNNIVPNAISWKLMYSICSNRLRDSGLKTFYAILNHFWAIIKCIQSNQNKYEVLNQIAFPLTHLSLTFWRSLFYVGSVSAKQCIGRDLVARCWASKCIYRAKVDVMLVILSNYIQEKVSEEILN